MANILIVPNSVGISPAASSVEFIAFVLYILALGAQFTSALQFVLIVLMPSIIVSAAFAVVFALVFAIWTASLISS